MEIAMATVKPKKKPSGGAHIKAAGKSPLLLALDPSDKQKIRTAAGFAGLPMSQFLILHGVAAAEKILEKI
jgi:uncharacterized protein (DUF1778 family)